MIKNIVIIDNNSTPKGGTAQVATSSAMELSKRGFFVTYIAADGLDGKFLSEHGVKVVNLNQYELKENPSAINAMKNGIWNDHVYKTAKKLLRDYDKNDTVIHIHGYLHRFSVSIVKACVDSGIKTILTLHDYFILCPSGGFYDYSNNSVCCRKPMSLSCMLCNCDKRNYLQKIWRVLRQFKVNKYVRYNKNLRLIYISEINHSRIRKYLSSSVRTFYVKNPYDIGPEYTVDANNNVNYVFLGRLSSEKGVDLFCKAYTTLKKQNLIRGNAIVYGDGDQKAILESQYPLVHFLGWKNHDEIDEVVKSARALVFPSKWYEGSPLTPVEFMSHGVPCISSDVCSAIEYIKDGWNGLVFKSEDVNDLMEKLVISEDAEKWDRISQNLISEFDRESYSLRSHVTRLIEVYEEVLNEK